ncbi:siderophore-interacting protein [Streptomyces sp. NPDC050560]|uniref:siderophore-interacting protein n=1 Tax=Streptomyces sp. NPDC050560 TaxID=3365630 RepID=UPI003798F739
MKGRVLNLIFERGEVEFIQPLAKRMRRIRLTGPALKGLDYIPGQHIRLHVNDLFAPLTWRKGLLRTYSVWAYDGEALDLCVLTHGGDGPGEQWAREAKAGQEVWLTKPEGSFVLRPDAGHHLFVGDETAAVPFGPMLRALPEGAGFDAVVEVDTPDDQIPLPEGVTWCHRDGASAARSTSLVEAVRRLDLPGEGDRAAYVAGEALTVQAVRDHLVRERGWPRRSVLTKPFWTPGKRGMD